MATGKQPRVVLIIQGRMAATRLPGKPLKPVLGRPLLAYLIERVQRCKTVDAIVVATTTNSLDGAIAEFCQKNHIACFRGSESDVLDRYLQAARHYKADVIVRVTGDCPLIDPQVIDTVVSYFLQHKPPLDYATNCLERTFPRGMDVEVFSMKSFEKVAKKAKNESEREHVTPYYYRHPELFKLGNVTRETDDSRYRLTVDEEDDFTLIETLLKAIYVDKPHFTLEDILQVFKQHPEWIKINAHVQQKLV